MENIVKQLWVIVISDIYHTHHPSKVNSIIFDDLGGGAKPNILKLPWKQESHDIDIFTFNKLKNINIR